LSLHGCDRVQRLIAFDDQPTCRQLRGRVLRDVLLSLGWDDRLLFIRTQRGFEYLKPFLLPFGCRITRLVNELDVMVLLKEHFPLVVLHNYRISLFDFTPCLLVRSSFRLDVSCLASAALDVKMMVDLLSCIRLYVCSFDIEMHIDILSRSRVV